MGTLFTEDVLLGLSGSTTRNSREGEILEERLYFFPSYEKYGSNKISF